MDFFLILNSERIRLTNLIHFKLIDFLIRLEMYNFNEIFIKLGKNLEIRR